MVIFLLIFFIIPGITLFSQEVDAIKISAEVDLYTAIENQPLPGTITISHPTDVQVDPNSFRLENTPLQVEKIKSIKISPKDPMELTIYRFTLPGKEKGLYMLPAMEVSIGGKLYRSIPSSYEVKGGSASKRPVPQTQSAKEPPAALILKSSLDGPDQIYPGQRMRFVYKIYYKGNIALTAQQLPLLDPLNFVKIGDRKVEERQEGDFSIQEIVQEAKAVKPGQISFPISYIEGYAVAANNARTGPKLRSELPAQVLTVYDFPITGKPSTFDGAIGPFTFDAHLLTLDSVHVDEKMLLALSISGIGDFTTVNLPNLDRLKPLFRFSDLPPRVQTANDTKQFVVELYPLSTEIKEIPSISFSYFDPLIKDYVVLQSTPIPIKISPPESEKQKPIEESPVPKLSSPLETQTPASQAPSIKQPETYRPPAIEVGKVYPLTSNDIGSLWFGTWNTLWVVPIGLLTLLIELLIQDYLNQRRKRPIQKNSSQIWQEAMRAPPGSSTFYQLFNQAFMQRLIEGKYIPSKQIPPEKLPQEGIIGKVRSLLFEIEKQRYAENKEKLTQQELQHAEELFKTIKSTVKK